MSELIAWGDESVQTQGGASPLTTWELASADLKSAISADSCFPRPSEKSPSCIGVT